MSSFFNKSLGSSKASIAKSMLKDDALTPQIENVHEFMENTEGHNASVVSSHYGENDEESYGRPPFSIDLGGNLLTFDKGQWKTDSTLASVKDTSVHRKNEKLIEENNALRFKIELLLDMLATSRAEFERLKESRSNQEGC